MRTRTIVTLAIAAVISVPTAFYAAKHEVGTTPPPKPSVNALPIDPVVLRKQGITDRLTKCTNASNAKSKERCFAEEQKRCDQEGGEKTWCVQRTLVGKLSGSATTCGTVRSAGERQRCLKRLWANEKIADRRTLADTDRREVCATFTTQTDRDRCLMAAARQSKRDGGTDRSLCQHIQDGNLQANCLDD